MFLNYQIQTYSVGDSNSVSWLFQAQLRPRKQRLEEELLRQREEQEKFYVGAIKNENDDMYHDCEYNYISVARFPV